MDIITLELGRVYLWWCAIHQMLDKKMYPSTWRTNWWVRFEYWWLLFGVVTCRIHILLSVPVFLIPPLGVSLERDVHGLKRRILEHLRLVIESNIKLEKKKINWASIKISLICYVPDIFSYCTIFPLFFSSFFATGWLSSYNLSDAPL